MDCVFCSIVAGTAPAWRLHEDEDTTTAAFLDVGPATPGHTLVVPRRHAPDIWSVTEDEAAAVMRSVHRVARRLRARLAPDGLTVVQSNGAAAWQEVAHFHVHLVPRYDSDGLVPPWTSTATSAEDLAALHRRLTRDRGAERIGRFVQPTSGDLATDHHPHSSAPQETPRRLTCSTALPERTTVTYPRPS